MEEILIRLQKLENELKKEREINRNLQFQIADMNEELFNLKEENSKIYFELNNLQKEILYLKKENSKKNEYEKTILSKFNEFKEEFNIFQKYQQSIIHSKSSNKEEVITHEILKKDLTFSKILDCVIDNKKPDVMSYRNILIHVFKKMNKEDILKHSSFNFKEEEVYDGYHWCEDIQLSFQNKDAKNTLKEIIRLCELNKYVLFIQIKLSTREIITYRSTK
jgi:hypothetical protein